MPSGNLSQGFSMTPPPMPASSDVNVQPYVQQPSQVQMPQQYYGGKAGGVAFMADKILTGFLAGTKARQEKQANQMAQEIGSAKTGLDIIGQAYKAAVDSGDQKKIQQASQALSEAYNDYLNKAEKYALPDQKIDPKTGKPKKSKNSQGNPNAPIAESTIQIMRQTDPKMLYGPSKEDQQKSKQLDMQTKQMEAKQADDDRWAKISQADPSSITPEDKRFLEYYEFKNFELTPAQQKLDATKDQLLGKILDGKQPLTEQEHDLAEQFGFVKPDVINTVTRTVPDAKGNPQTQLVSIGPKGKVVGTQILPGNDYVPPNQAQVAQQTINAQMSAMMKWGAKAHPDWSKQQLTQWALSTVGGGTQQMDWSQKSEQMDIMNRALQATLAKHTKSYKDENGNPVSRPDEVASSMLGNVVSTTSDGRYAYMPQLAAGTKEGGSSWYKPWTWGHEGTEKWSGMTREQLNSQERQFQAELRAELKKQNPKLTDAQLDKMVPPMLTSQGAASQGEPSYSVTLPNGTKATRKMSPEYADALAARGVKVEPVGQ